MYERKILLGFIRAHILYHASDKKGIYGVELIQELETHGYTISPGTLYPILHEMQEQKLIQVTKKNVKGKIRKIYHITHEGTQTLNKLKQFIHELSQEVLQ